MYVVDGDDLVAPLDGIPRCDAGAPEPVLAADESNAVVAYNGTGGPINWDTAEPEELGDVEVVVLRFHAVHSLMFGSPNDEALHGHPLADRGLRDYAAHRVLHSSWVRALETMNRVHSMHSAEAFSLLSHFILTFHDSTFECVCRGEPAVTITTGSAPWDAAVACLSANRD